MSVRTAKYSDVQDIHKYLKRMHASTGWDFLPINDKVLRESVVGMVRTQDIADVLVSYKDGEVNGVLLATVDRFFWNKQFYATDVHFIADGGGPALLQAFKHWAQQRKVECIIMAVATNDPRAEAFLNISGFERRGGAMVCRFDELKEKAA